MNQHNAVKTAYNTPFIPQRADPYILHDGGKYYFTASVPAYDRIILRCADTLEGLRTAPETEIWHCHHEGVMSRHIWAPELHHIDGRWYVYFAAGEMEDCWKIRPWVLACEGDDPMTGVWTEAGQLARQEEFSFTDFSLDMTTFEVRGRRYCIWAEKVSVGKKISNLYIAEMASPLELATPQMLLTSPTYAWERHNFWVNEGAAFMHRDGRVYIAYSASDTGPAYCMGLLWANEDDDLMDFSVWHKVNCPVMKTDAEKGIYGPGHNSFFTGDDGEIYMAYHARPYDEIIGDPLYDPNRHCYIMKLEWKDGMPVFDYANQLFQD
ncbi:MAG: family 43 glycosylhydrolase [Clostridia bacterium]|nr:family 43 glycosylhydrolase [Clostridia bacterium]